MKINDALELSIVALTLCLCLISCSKASQDLLDPLEEEACKEFILAGCTETTEGGYHLDSFRISLADSLDELFFTKSALDLSVGLSVHRPLDLDGDGLDDLEFGSAGIIRASTGRQIHHGETYVKLLANRWQLGWSHKPSPYYIKVYGKGDTIWPEMDWSPSSLYITTAGSICGVQDTNMPVNCNLEAYLAVRETLEAGHRLYWIRFATDTLGINLYELAHN